jgi:hypothetical protein
MPADSIFSSHLQIHHFFPAMNHLQYSETKWQQWHAGKQWLSVKKEPLPATACSMLRSYVDGKYDDDGNGNRISMTGCTFAHIIDYYWSCGEKISQRFLVACADYGYTEAELSRLFFTENKTPKDIAKEIIERPRPKDEDDY